MKKSKIIFDIKEEFPDISKKDINRIIDIVFNSIADCCENGGTYTQNNFGKFSLKERSQRKGRNIETGEIIIIPKAKTIKFSISKTRFKKLNNINLNDDDK